MSKKRRFYQLTYPNDGKPVLFEDMGNTLSISGVLLQGKGLNTLALLPSAEKKEVPGIGGFPIMVADVIQPTLEEWSELIRQSDDPVFFEEEESGVVKAIHRKQHYAISGNVQQRIWVRDNLTCIFCLRVMGEVSLSVDHFVPLEAGGANDETNYVTACRRCNKDKGNMDEKEYCERVGVWHQGVKDYMAGDIPFWKIRLWDTEHSIREISNVKRFYQLSKTR